MEKDFIPRQSESSLRGEEILLSPLADFWIIIEDTDKLDFYLNIFNTIFSNKKILSSTYKILSGKGKNTSIREAEKNMDKRNKIYIVDMDFDDITGRIVQLSNLIYLEKYSIENYLITKEALFEIIYKSNRMIRLEELELNFHFENEIQHISNCFSKLSCINMIISYKDLRLRYIFPSIPSDLDTKDNIIRFRSNFFEDEKFQNLNKTFHEQFPHESIYQLTEDFLIKYFNDIETAMAKIPGKQIINFLNYYLPKKGLIRRPLNPERFTYELSRKIKVDSFNNLKESIERFVSSTLSPEIHP